jgi:hypothetical protein
MKMFIICILLVFSISLCNASSGRHQGVRPSGYVVRSPHGSSTYRSSHVNYNHSYRSSRSYYSRHSSYRYYGSGYNYGAYRPWRCSYPREGYYGNIYVSYPDRVYRSNTYNNYNTYNTYNYYIIEK